MAVWTRRALIAGGILATVGWVRGAPHLAGLIRPAPEFEDIPGLAPFRRLLKTGAASQGVAILAGLDPATSEENTLRLALHGGIRADPCHALFGSLPQDGSLPVAMFSDFACPICRVMEERLSALDPGSIRVVRHQLPILGAASATASRAVLAADLQGAYAEMHAQLIRTPAVTDEDYVAAVAADLGLNADRLLSDMRSNEIKRRIWDSAALADMFGFYGTPAFAVGRTVFMGLLSKAALRDLIATENAEAVSLTHVCSVV